MNSIPVIDYFSHPAFANLGVVRNSGDALLEEMNAIDAVLRDAANASQFELGTAMHWERLLAMVNDSVTDEVLRDRAKLAVTDAADTMYAYCRWRSKPKKKFSAAGKASDCTEQIEAHGAAVLNFPDAVRSQLYEMLADERAQTRSRHDMNPIDRCTLHMPSRGPAFDLAWKTLESEGWISALNSLFGREMNPIYFYLAFNTATEAWYKDGYADVGLPTSRFAYAHFDHDFDLAKIQIYLSDVGEDNGPFAFVPRSPQWIGCKTQQFIFKEMDKAFKFPKNESLYYRPRFGSPEHRRALLQLPVPLQGSSHFGDDVVEGTELSRQLEESFRVVTSDQGNCCIFAGGDLLHYGGLVSGADRWVIQFGLAAEQPHSAGPAPKRSILAKMATKSRKYVGDETIDKLRRILGYSGAAPPQSEYTPNVSQ